MVNLGFNNEGAFAFVPNLEDFEYLDYDVIVLYEGYNDLPGDEGVEPIRLPARIRRSTAPSVTYPILPLYLDEKAMTLRYGSDLNVGVRGSAPQERTSVVFRPNLAKRTSAGALEAIAAMTRALDGQLEKTGTVPPPAIAANRVDARLRVFRTSPIANRWPRRCGSGSIAARPWWLDRNPARWATKRRSCIRSSSRC